MKNVSKLALFVAAGMVSAGVNAATIEIPDGTSMSLEGEFTSDYIVNETVNADSSAKGNDSDLEGEATLGLTAERSFDGFDGYVELGYTFGTQKDGGSDLDSDGAVAGLKGNFGQLEVGDTDSVYEDLITDAADIFEQASLTYGSYDSGETAVDENNMITFYSPEANGFSVNFQLGLLDEAEASDGSTDANMIISAAYDVGPAAFHVGYNDFGVKSNSSDELLGLAAVFGVGPAEVSLVHEMETIGGADTDYTGMTVAVSYGAGDVYGAVQSVSPDANNKADLSQYAVGVSADLADGLSAYAEYGNLDGQTADDKDTVMAVGVAFGF
mgnify:FL=1